MILAGDEIGRTQKGNNNAYCQDNEISWVDWTLDRDKKALLEFVKYLVHIRKTNPVLNRRKFFKGQIINGSSFKDITWFRTDGKEMTHDDWINPITMCIGLKLSGEAIEEVDDKGNRIYGDSLLIILNAYWNNLNFTLPKVRTKCIWELVVDTRLSDGKPDHSLLSGGDTYQIYGRSVALFRLSQD